MTRFSNRIAVVQAGTTWDERLARASAAHRSENLDPAFVTAGPEPFIEEWRESVDPLRDGALARRLAWSDIDPSQVALHDTSTGDPHWMPTLRKLLDLATNEAPEVHLELADLPFVDVFWPMASALWEEVDQLGLSVHLMPAAKRDLQALLLDRWTSLSAHSLFRLFAPDRSLRDVIVSHARNPRGELGAERNEFSAFCATLTESRLHPLLEQFPVLGRLLAITATNWRATIVEFLQRLQCDDGPVRNAFGVAAKSDVERVWAGLSDSHRNGRCVMIIQYTDGTRVVYKPRDLRIEAFYQRLVSQLGAALAGPAMRPLGVLARGESHGYAEYLPHEPARTTDDLRGFYRNVGRQVALMYFLGGSDCHYDNFIASADQFACIDAETLFEGTGGSTLAPPATPKATGTATRVSDSVLRSGILPSWTKIGLGVDDLSATGISYDQRDSNRGLGWCFVNTDDMVWAPTQVAAPNLKCLPVVRGEANPISRHKDAVVQGFGEVYDWFSATANRDWVVERLGPLKGATRRVVLRPTRVYVELQQEAAHPNCTADPLARGLVLDRLARAFLTTREKPPDWQLLQCEIAATDNLDVPYFTQPLGTLEVHDPSRGTSVIVGESDGLHDAVERMFRASSADRRWQESLIAVSIAAMNTSVDTDSGIAIESAPEPPTAAAFSAKRIGHQLVSEMIDDERLGPTWMALNLVPGTNRVQLGVVADGLYDGLSGITAFLIDSGFSDQALMCLQPLVTDILSPREVGPQRLRAANLGFTGVGGHLRQLLYLHQRHGEKGPWLKAAEKLAQQVTQEAIDADTSHDLLTGAAGTLGPLSVLHKLLETEWTRSLASRLGDHLLAAQQAETGAWLTISAARPLTGWSHGASGIAVALAEAWSITGESRYLDGATRALAYEASVFDAERGNWPDFRKRSEGSYMTSWCHGAPGIALARLRMLQLVPTHAHRGTWHDELNIAITTTQTAEPVRIDHLCCGNLGRAAILGLIGTELSDSDLTGHAARLADKSTRAAERRGYYRVLAMDGNYEQFTPGLMTGVAGVGMMLTHVSDYGWVRALLV